MSNPKLHTAGTTGRDIIDSVVEANASVNYEIYDKTVNNPGYFRQVNIGCEMLNFQGAQVKKNIERKSLVDDIIISAINLKLDDGPAEVVVNQIPITTHKSIVAFIKACVAGSASGCPAFSEAVADFTTELINNVVELNLPITVNAKSKIGAVVIAELNDGLKLICDANSIPYKTVVEVKKKSIKETLVEAEG